MYKVIIAGSREFDNYQLLEQICDSVLESVEDKSKIVIITGGARGADKLGIRYANNKQYKLEVHPADWNRYGKLSSFIRNEEMALQANALIAFWDGKSPGTKSMIDVAQKRKLITRIVRYESWNCD